MSGNNTHPAYLPSLLYAYTMAFEGICISCVLYGAYIVIAVANLSMLKEKRYKILFTYSIIQLVITTLYCGFSLYTAPTQSLAIFGIVKSYDFNALSPWQIVITDAAFVLNAWASDGFLLYRCSVIWKGNMYALAVPMLLYLVTVAASIAWLVVGSRPGAVYSTHAIQVAGLALWTCSAAMNVFASCLISARFWMHRRTMMRAIQDNQGTFYLGYMAMTLESAALYTVFAIIALVMFALNSPLENVFFPVLGIVQAIAPSLIIYRIARGISLRTDQQGDSTAMSSLRFLPSGWSRSAMRSRRRDVFDGPVTVPTSSDESDKTDRNGCETFVQEVKNDAAAHV